MSRNVLVTGGGTGIGRAVAARFAAAGDDVVITGRRPEPLRAAAAELPVRPVRCDGTDPDQLSALLDDLPEHLDVLVNNAGGNTDFDAAEPTELKSLATAWRANFEANVITAVLTTQAVSDRLVAGGAVIHIGSIAAEKGAGSYGAAKAAIASWNIGLARELGRRGITTNVVSPGYIGDTEFFRDTLTEERRGRLIADTAVGRPGTPADVADTIYFLASPAARHITGQLVHVNGGAWPTR